VCEMNGAVLQNKIGRFRAIPFYQRHKISLSKKVEKLIDVSKERLDEMEEEESDDEQEYEGKDLQFHKVRLKPGNAKGDSEESDEESEPEEEEPGREEAPEDELGPRRSKRNRVTAESVEPEVQ